MSDIDLVKSHLEFLGYATELNGITYTASNPYRFDFLFEEHKGSVILRQDYPTNDYAKANRDKLLEFVNTVNRIIDVSSVNVDADSNVEFAAYCVGPYNKIIFGRMLELWDNDLKTFFRDHEFSNFFNAQHNKHEH